MYNKYNDINSKVGIILFIFVISTILAGCIALLKFINNSSFLPLSRLVVTGKMQYTTNDDIRNAILALGKPGAFMLQDVNMIQRQIKLMPWIKQVSVRKKWPNELEIHLVEYVPVARWNDLHMIDKEGKYFSVPINYSRAEMLPLLYGPKGNEKDVLNGYYKMSAMLAVSNIHVKAASMTARHSWQLITDNDIRIELGRNDNIERLQRFIKIWPVIQQQIIINNKHVGYVDLRYDFSAAVGWDPAFINFHSSNQQQN